MAKLKLDLHDFFNNGEKIDSTLHDIMRQAVTNHIKVVEIIPGKGSGQLKKRALRFLQQKEIKQHYQRLEKDSKNLGKLFVHFKH